MAAHHIVAPSTAGSPCSSQFLPILFRAADTWTCGTSGVGGWGNAVGNKLRPQPPRWGAVPACTAGRSRGPSPGGCSQQQAPNNRQAHAPPGHG